MIVIRVESRRDPMEGAYNLCADDVYDTHTSGTGWVDMPAPFKDPGIRRPAHYTEVCCCHSYEQFYQWWPEPTLEALAQRNLWAREEQLDVVILRVRESASTIGRYQCLTRRKEADELERISVEHFVKLSQRKRDALLKAEVWGA